MVDFKLCYLVMQKHVITLHATCTCTFTPIQHTTCTYLLITITRDVPQKADQTMWVEIHVHVHVCKLEDGRLQSCNHAIRLPGELPLDTSSFE